MKVGFLFGDTMAFRRTQDIIKPQDVFRKIHAFLVDTTVNGSEKRLDELESLCMTAGISVVGRKAINVNHINSALYIGSGQANEIRSLSHENDANLIVFNNSINPRVQRNLEDLTKLAVVDRQEIILQIFANRASTKEARLQVELAQLQYSLGRLSRKWANLSQQRGGVKGAKGSGEKQLELDKRTAQSRISHLKKEIAVISRQRSVQRRNRLSNDICNVVIVGYTNSGKSTLLNRISDAQVLSEDKLFATLDTTTRKVFMPSGRTCLFTDTVGFVSDLPHELVDAFKSTLEEATLCDILLIVLDVSREDVMMCWETTVNVLKSLDAFDDKKRLVLLNKTDLLEPDRIITIPGEQTMNVSVLKDKSMGELLKTIDSMF